MWYRRARHKEGRREKENQGEKREVIKTDAEESAIASKEKNKNFLKLDKTQYGEQRRRLGEEDQPRRWRTVYLLVNSAYRSTSSPTTISR